MIRTLFVVLALAVLANGNTLRRGLEPLRAKLGVLSAGPSMPVKYVTGIEEPQEPEEEWAVPQYVPAKIEKPNPSVTEGFCKQMLSDIKAKKAPYFLEGKFTGESRKELVTQCGQRICTWGTEIAEATAPECSDNCPQKCEKPKVFLDNMLENEDMLAAFIASLMKHTASAEAKAAPGASGARFKGVTKEFCEHILNEVKAKKAPYWIVDHETGVAEPTEETRSGIVQTCSKKVCDFMTQYQELTKVADCNQGALQKLANARHLLPLLEKITEVIKAQPEPEEEEAPVDEEVDEEDEGPQPEDLITPNDPRDPEFDSGATAATGIEEDTEGEAEA